MFLQLIIAMQRLMATIIDSLGQGCMYSGFFASVIKLGRRFYDPNEEAKF
jgi:hypothetical protein